MNTIIKNIEDAQLKAQAPEFRVGDTVRVSAKIKEGNRERIQVFEGTVLKKQGTGVRATFTVRKISNGVGVALGKVLRAFKHGTSLRRTDNGHVLYVVALLKVVVYALYQWVLGAYHHHVHQIQLDSMSAHVIHDTSRGILK